MGKWLHKNGLRPCCVVSPPAVRARQTTPMASKAMGFQADRVVGDGRICEGGQSELRAILANCPASCTRIQFKVVFSYGQ